MPAASDDLRMLIVKKHFLHGLSHADIQRDLKDIALYSLLGEN